MALSVMAFKRTDTAVYRLAALWFSAGLTWSLLATSLLPKDVAALVDESERGFRLGLIYSVAALISVVFPPIIGAWSDRQQTPRIPIILGVGVMVIGLGGLVLARDLIGYGGYFVAAIVIECGSSVMHGAYASIVPRFVPHAAQGAASGAITAMRLTGTILGVIAGVVLTSRLAQGVVAAAILIAGCVVVLSALQSGSSEKIAQDETRVRGSSTDYRPFLFVTLARFFGELGRDAIQPFLLYFLTDVIIRFQVGPTRFGRPEEAQAVLLLIILITAGGSSLLAGHFLNQFGRRRMMWLGALVQAVAALGFAALTDYSAILVVGFVFGLGQGAFLVSSWALTAEVLPSKSHAGRDMGIWHIALVATGLFSSGFGQLLDRAGYNVLFGLSSLSLVCSAVVLMGVQRR
jgi:MFS family permease